MPACQSEKSVFIALFSRMGVFGRAMRSPVGHPAFLPSASQSRRWKQRATDCKTAIPGDIGLFSAAEASMEFPAGLADRWF